jgi:chromosome segregation ATPase
MFESNDVPGKAEFNDPTTTFEHIMKTLAEHETISPEETALQHKLSEAQAQLQAEKERADNAAQELIGEKLQTTKSEHECVAY